MEVSRFSLSIPVTADSRRSGNETGASSGTMAIDRPKHGTGQDFAVPGSTGETAPQRFNTQLIVALLNAQGHEGGSLFEPGGTQSLGLEQILAGRAAYNVHGYAAIVSSEGQLEASSLEGKTAEGLAEDLVNAFGSGGSLDLSDIERALGIKDSPVDQRILAKIEDVIEEKWSMIAKGSYEVSAGELSAVIRNALGVAK